MLIFFSIGSLIGATALNFFSILPPPHFIVVAVGVSSLLTMVGIWLFRINIALKKTLILVLGLLIGFSWAYTSALQKVVTQFPEQDFNRVIQIQGKVDGVSQFFDNTLRFDVQIADRPLKIRLFWRNPETILKDGDTIFAHVKLKPIWRYANPGSFDQEKQLFLEGISATGKVISIQRYQRSHTKSLSHLRQALNDQIADLLKDKPLLGVIQATTIGIYKNITPEQWQVFQATGTSHAIAISGLHISLVAMLCAYITAFITRRSMFLTTLYPAKCYCAIGALIGAVIYSAIAGFSIPTQRSLIMIMVALIAVLMRRPILSWHALAFAWIGIAIFDPLAPLQMGFWLSFFCVGALIYGGSHSQGGRWRKWIMPQCVVFIGLIPLTALFFHQIAILSPLANFIVLPVINIVVIPASLLGVVLIGISTNLAAFFLSVAHFALESIWIILEKIGALSFSLWEVGPLPWFPILLAFCGAILILSPSGIPGRNLGWLAFFPMIFYQAPQLQHGECRFTLLDVGQGLASVVQTQNHVLLYDAGPPKIRILKPFFRYQNIKKLDKVIISHTDLDHRGGLEDLTDWPITELLTSEPERLGFGAKQCEAGSSWEWDGIKFLILGPLDTTLKKRNDLSCVLKVESTHHQVLLTGDIEKTAERKLITSYNTRLKSSILVVPHHGSLTSSTKKFIQSVSPEYALFPVGFNNHYGFPKPSVIQQYKDLGVENLLSWQTGALLFHLGSRSELTPPICWRKASRHYWHKI